jgi:hypothetical protein
LIVKRYDGTAWNGTVWLRIGINGGLLWTRSWLFAFHKTQGNSWLAQEVSASKELCSMGLVWVLSLLHIYAHTVCYITTQAVTKQCWTSLSDTDDDTNFSTAKHACDVKWTQI